MANFLTWAEQRKRQRYLKKHVCMVYGRCQTCNRPMRTRIGGFNVWCRTCWDLFYTKYL